MVADAVLVSSTEGIRPCHEVGIFGHSQRWINISTRRGRRLTEIQFFHAVRPGSGTHH